MRRTKVSTPSSRFSSKVAKWEYSPSLFFVRGLGVLPKFDGAGGVVVPGPGPGDEVEG
jgi:hypothetical protein